ncbi:uncharacterized protein M421DRAFT_96822 [Didymella exigua CBS 183.55]|uniref:Uncharacterized protein n=1 Tax=Didymella exigua CBS 183.55 TaxID=1150837 RepID=A0A6A5R5A5_9PLEO|nr:uncharacterized protein M421DRAFT_96822 [Didymella exigua CBS 183.55]KAF1922360.1 hypothetical protein M421DRAFT_96822 [Didymella exigua CBS 183.55]
MAKLIRVLGSASRCLDVEAERYGCPLFAAAATSSEQALEVCLESISVRKDESSPVAAVQQSLGTTGFLRFYSNLGGLRLIQKIQKIQKIGLYCGGLAGMAVRCPQGCYLLQTPP